MAENQLKTASVLAFERKLDCSDGLFYSGDWNDIDNNKQWPSIQLREKAVRGTISNRLKSNIKKDPTKLDAEVQKPNLQTVDVATLPESCDTLRLRFTLKVLPGVGFPSACNNAAYRQKLLKVVEGYKDENGFTELAKRYAYNLANGRFLWRNRMSSEKVKVQVRQIIHGEQAEEAKNFTFEALDYKLREFAYDDEVKKLGKLIELGLNGDNFILLEVITHALMGKGQEVFPSQELVLDRSGKSKKSKFLYKIGETAAMHSQKIGNALRTIDTWYPQTEGESLGPIAVEPYGSVTSLGKAYRTPKEKKDFYTLLDNWVLKDKTPDLDQQHFVMATFVRGGVFGDSKKDKDK